MIVDVHPEVTQVWSEPLTQRKTEDWLQIFRNADLAAVQMITHEDHPTEGRTAVLHVRSVPTAIGYRCEAHLPPRGWHMLSVLEQLGYTKAEV